MVHGRRQICLPCSEAIGGIRNLIFRSSISIHTSALSSLAPGSLGAEASGRAKPWRSLLAKAADSCILAAMSCPKVDFHIHNKYGGCAYESMDIAAIAVECEKQGLETIAMTDHINKPGDEEKHVKMLEEVGALETSLDVYFGCEVNFTGKDAGFAMSAEIKEKYGFQFIIGGIHSLYLDAYDEKEFIDIQHRHHLKTCADPLVDVLVHPYWIWLVELGDINGPDFESLDIVPEAYRRELAQTARDTGTAIEINANACIANDWFSDRWKADYEEYVALLFEEGASFSVGSDAHDIPELGKIHACWDLVEKLGIPEDRIWLPPMAPVKKRNT